MTDLRYANQEVELPFGRVPRVVRGNPPSSPAAQPPTGTKSEHLLL